MKYISIILLVAASLQAFSYSSKIQAYENYSVSSEYEGKVTYVNKAKEFSKIKERSVIVKLDTSLEDIELSSLKKSIKIQNEVLKIKETHYQNKLGIDQLSIYEKNNEKLQLLTAKQNIQDLQKSVDSLDDKISKKVFKVKNRYLYMIYVHEGEYVQAGTKLYSLYNFSKLKLAVYVKMDELNSLKKATVYVDGKKSSFKVSKVAKVVDAKRVSRYRVELYKECKDIDRAEIGKVVEVEFRL